MLILNLGCGLKTSAHPAVVNLDHSIYFRLRYHPLWRRVAPWVTRGERRAALLALPANLRLHDLTRGLPYADASVDLIYHSHFLEHLDRDAAVVLLREVRRVLVPGGLQRVVVPDLEPLCRAYLASLEQSLLNDDAQALHERHIAALLEQSVRREAFGSAHQPQWRRRLEGLLFGDARRRGETHQWMYDRVSLPRLLAEQGFHTITLCRFDTSALPDWDVYGLDRDATGAEYRPGSLYVEARC